MVQIDAAELEELERVIMALTEEAEKAEARVDQLHKVPVRDVLKFIIGNSDSANVTITEAGVADEALSKLPTTSGMGSYRPSQSGMKSGSYLPSSSGFKTTGMGSYRPSQSGFKSGGSRLPSSGMGSFSRSGYSKSGGVTRTGASRSAGMSAGYTQGSLFTRVS